MNYDNKLEELVVSDEKWPWFTRPEVFHELQNLAESAYSKNNIEGYLSSVLIHQQLVEEMTLVLLKDSQFLIKIGLWGTAEIEFPDQKGVMFGRLIDEIKKTISFDEKEEFITECNILNSIRINIVHGLAKHESVESIPVMAEKARKHYARVAQLFASAHGEFMRKFNREKDELISTHQYEMWSD